jgi:hypothetical protein
VDYDLNRLHAHRDRDTLGSAINWDILALVRCQPDGQILAASVTKLVSNLPRSMPLYRSPAIASFPVPGDAVSMELWFLNIGYTHFEPSKAWDSHFGDNYVFTIVPNPTAQPVALRTGARAARDVVNAMQLRVEKERHEFPGYGSFAGSFKRFEFQTRIKLTAWVRNLAYPKNVWFDAHVVDGGNQLIQAQTLPLHYKVGGGGGGDLFDFDDVLYHGSDWWRYLSPRPDARRVQLRLYFEAGGQLFTDGILHDRQLVEDTAVY